MKGSCFLAFTLCSFHPKFEGCALSASRRIRGRAKAACWHPGSDYVGGMKRMLTTREQVLSGCIPKWVGEVQDAPPPVCVTPAGQT